MTQSTENGMTLQEARKIVNHAFDNQKFGPEREQGMNVLNAHIALQTANALDPSKGGARGSISS